MFEYLVNRYVLKGNIKLLSPLATSSGEADEYTDAPLTRDLDGNPIIHGSSFRGALRSTIERLLSALGRPTCLLGANPRTDCLTVSESKGESIKKMLENPKVSERCVSKAVYGLLCPACRLFGSLYLASKLRVSDLEYQTSSDPSVVIRHRVGIDRDTETAKSGAKFDCEVLEDGAFKMELIIENATDEDLGILGLGIIELLDGDFWIGGDQAVGAGRCRLENLEIFCFGYNGWSLINFLQSDKSGTERYLKMDEPMVFVQEKVDGYVDEEERDA